MSEIKIRRRSRQVPITLTTSTASATTLYLEDFAGGVIDIGTIATAANMQSSTPMRIRSPQSARHR